MHLVYAVQEVADVLDDLLFFVIQFHLFFESFEGCVDLGVVRDCALVFIRVDVEQGLRVLREADRCDRLGA